MGELIRKPLVWAIGGLLLLAAAWWLVSSLTGGKRAQVEARLNSNRADAASASGKDAVNTVGARGAAESSIDGKVNDANRNVAGASDAAGADAAGRDGLCSIAPDLCPASAVPRPDPR